MSMEPLVAGRVLENPVSGERIVIRLSGSQTGGQLLVFDLFLPPGGHVPAQHVHPVQEERFTVLEGRMRFRLSGRTVLSAPGESVVIPPGVPHWFGNAGSDVSHARVEVRPALRMEDMFEATAMMRHIPGTRLPRPWDLAFVISEFQRELSVPRVPARVAKAVLAPLAWMGRRRRQVRRAPGH
jgi:quercetin dioxygenase-like cupin family protein